MSEMLKLAERLRSTALAMPDPSGGRFIVWAFFHPFKFGQYHGRLTTLAEVSSEARSIANKETSHDPE